MINNSKKIVRGFWDKLPKPFMVLAPMAEVTDCSFRHLINLHSTNNTTTNSKFIIFNEFISSEGLVHNPNVMLPKLRFEQTQHNQDRPIVAQFFGGRPDPFRKSAEIAKLMGYNGVDLNFGCPSRKVITSSGAALINNPKLASEIINATRQGAGDIPVSIKTRIGFNEIEIERWIPQLLEQDPVALTLHLRTKKELSLVPAHWTKEVAGRCVQLRNELNPSTLMIGNGDVKSIQDAYEKAKEFGFDGIMIGRAVYGNPWFFDPLKIPEYIPGHTPPTFQQQNLIDQMNGGDLKMITVEERFNVVLEHALLDEFYTPNKPIQTLAKHYHGYFNPIANLGDTKLPSIMIK
eukprot:gene1994-2455_t